MAGERERLVLVVGPGRSGTSLLCGMLRPLGFHVPQPEFPATIANPTGYSESVWVYRLHEALLKRAEVRYISIEDPAQFERCAEAAEEHDAAGRIAGWLTEQFRIDSRLLVKDPRTVFFVPAWLATARQLGIEVSFVSSFRHPLEVIGSQNHYYQPAQSAESRLRAWILTTLQAELMTRHHAREFVLYEDLVGSPHEALKRLMAVIGSPEEVIEPAAEGFAQATLHRIRGPKAAGTLDAGVRAEAESVWQLVRRLTDPAEEEPSVLADLDAKRRALGFPA